ncbi:MAG: diaminopropionate ammonia-lyase [Actinobacteria bacterium]|nr:diaminopropionate ammonia-lyase [Actinomycetota bacterium]
MSSESVFHEIFRDRDACIAVRDAAPRPLSHRGVPASVAFHRASAGYEPRPLVPLPQAARALGIARVWVKDETRRFGLPAFKVLGVSWAVHRLLCERLGLDPFAAGAAAALASRRAKLGELTLVAATDGNHGRAVARVGAEHGLATRIFVPAATLATRVAHIAGHGADVERVGGTYEDAVRHAERVADAEPGCLLISDTAWDGYELVPEWITDGYATLFAEIDDALGDARPDAVVVQIGVGALAQAAAHHFADGGREHRPALVGVEPLSAACVYASAVAGKLTSAPAPHTSVMDCLNAELPSTIALPALAQTYSSFVAISDATAEAAIALLREGGVDAGATGAAGLAGLLALSERGLLHRIAGAGRPSISDVVVICTEGADASNPATAPIAAGASEQE